MHAGKGPTTYRRRPLAVGPHVEPRCKHEPRWDGGPCPPGCVFVFLGGATFTVGCVSSDLGRSAKVARSELTQTHTYTHTRTASHEHTHAHTHTHTSIPTHAHIHTHTNNITQTHTRTHTHTHTSIPTHTYTHILAHTHTHPIRSTPITAKIIVVRNPGSREPRAGGRKPRAEII